MDKSKTKGNPSSTAAAAVLPEPQSDLLEHDPGKWFDSLPEEEQELLSETTAEYIEQLEEGVRVSAQTYLDRLPEHLRAAFRRSVNMTELVLLKEDLEREPAPTAEPELSFKS